MSSSGSSSSSNLAGDDMELEDLSPILAMAARADALLAHSRGNVAAAAVPSPAATPVVAAATPSSRPQQNSRPQQKQPAGQSSSRQGGHRSICNAHWRYGADARRCEKPCDWRAEN